MKKAAQIISYLFHPLIMPTLGLLLLLNSGTYISLLDPVAKRAILFVMALGTLIFPVMMIPILYYRKLVSNLQNASREERVVPQLIILILYVITFVYFARLPLSRVIHAYVLSASISLFLLLLVSIRIKLCAHMTALGGISGLIIALILLYETQIEVILLLVILSAGLTGSAKLLLGIQKPGEVLSGYLLGFAVVLATLLVY